MANRWGNSGVVPFSSCPQSLPASESFPMSQLFAWGGRSTGASALASFLPKKSQGWSPLEWTLPPMNWIMFSPNSYFWSPNTQRDYIWRQGIQELIRLNKVISQGTRCNRISLPVRRDSRERFHSHTFSLFTGPLPFSPSSHGYTLRKGQGNIQGESGHL